MNLNLTILGEAIAFALFVWFCLKFVWPPLTQALADRQKKIADGLKAAEKAQQDAHVASRMLEDKISEGKEKARGILQDAEKRARQIVEEAKQQAEQDASQVKAKLQEDLKAEAEKVREELRQQLSSLVMEGVEHIVEQHVDGKKHEQYLTELAQKL